MCRSRAEDRIYEYIFCLLVVSIPVIGQAMIANQGIGAEKIHMGMWICILLGTFLFVGDILMASGGKEKKKFSDGFFGLAVSCGSDIHFIMVYSAESMMSGIMMIIPKIVRPVT